MIMLALNSHRAYRQPNLTKIACAVHWETALSLADRFTALRMRSLPSHWSTNGAHDDRLIAAETCVRCTMSKTSQPTTPVR